MSLYRRQDRHLPVRPDLDQLKNQAKDLLRAVRAGDVEAIGEFNRFHPRQIDPANAKLADAQLALLAVIRHQAGRAFRRPASLSMRSGSTIVRRFAILSSETRICCMRKP